MNIVDYIKNNRNRLISYVATLIVMESFLLTGLYFMHTVNSNNELKVKPISFKIINGEADVNSASIEVYDEVEKQFTEPEFELCNKDNGEYEVAKFSSIISGQKLCTGMLCSSNLHEYSFKAIKESTLILKGWVEEGSDEEPQNNEGFEIFVNEERIGKYIDSSYGSNKSADERDAWYKMSAVHSQIKLKFENIIVLKHLIDPAVAISSEDLNYKLTLCEVR